MVYVDDAKNPYRGMFMSHMAADTLEELHEMAERLGLRRFFQSKKQKCHYDVCQTYRNKAIGFGAIEITQSEMVEKRKQMNLLLA